VKLLPFVGIYCIIIVSYLTVKLYFSWKNKPYKEEFKTTFSVIIPVYNEDSEVFLQCLKSVLSNNPDEIIVVDDGSSSTKCYELARKFPKVKVFRVPHGGKRFAQSFGIEKAKGDFLILMDSDTILDGGSIREILKPFRDGRIGAVCSSISALNRDENLLTNLLNVRYYLAGNVDRAAYSYFKVVTCCTGPFFAVRRKAVMEVLKSYTSQHHRGKLCTFGDDRHLTSLILRSWDVVFQRTAIAKTEVPSNFIAFLKQQLRWSRSFWRENYLLTKWMWKRSLPLSLFVTMDMLLPFLLLTLGLGLTLYNVFALSPYILGGYFLGITAMAWYRSLRYLFAKREGIFFLMPLYALIYLFFLLPLTIYAMFTTNKGGWMTR